MPWGVVAGAVSGGLGYAASQNGADAMQDGSNAAIAEQRRQFDMMRQDSLPYRRAGRSAMNRLSDLYGFDRKYDGVRPTGDQFVKNGAFDRTAYRAAMAKYNTGLNEFNNRERGGSLFQKDPGYDFRLNQGMQGLDRSANARGIGASGSALKELDRYNQDYASNEYGNYVNRLSAMAGVGQSANNSSAMLGQQNANGIAGLMSQNGMNQANMYQSSYGAINNGIQGAAGNYLFNKYLNRPSTMPDYTGQASDGNNNIYGITF